MVRTRIERAQALVIDALRELDLTDREERRIFEACLVATRRLGDARDACDAASKATKAPAEPVRRAA